MNDVRSDEDINDIYMKHIDGAGVFDRDTDGFTPCVQVDAHGSRFDLDFLTYIRDPKTKWIVSIGVPEVTRLWQLNDTREIHGDAKTAACHSSTTA